MQLKFYLDKPRQEKSPIILSIAFKSQRLKCGTGVVIPISAWDSDKQHVKRSYTDALLFNDSLDTLRSEVKKIYNMMELSRVEWNKESLKDFKKRIDHFRNPKKEVSVKQVSVDFKATLQDFNDNYITSKGIRPKDSTMKGYRTLLKHLEEFEVAKEYPLCFESITPEFYKQFVNYLYNEGLTDNAAGKYIKNIIVFLRYTQEKGLHTTEYYKDFEVMQRDADAIANTKEELDAIEKVDLSFSKALDDSRNMYLLQIYSSGIRYSDFTQLEPEHFHFDINRIIFHSLKTRQLLRIPITRKMKAILAKYPDLKLPFISNQKQNENIKKVCKLAGITEPIILSRHKGKDRIDRIIPKYQAIGTHTARRTFITLSLKMGVPRGLLKKTTGHVDDRSFDKYDKLSAEMACEAVENVWQ
ncbi:MAG: site-specific integrase [Bacteroidota bacterium]